MTPIEKGPIKTMFRTEINRVRDGIRITFTNSVLSSLPSLDKINKNPVLIIKESLLLSRDADLLPYILGINIEEPGVEDIPLIRKRAKRILINDSTALIKYILSKELSWEKLTPQEQSILKTLKRIRKLDGEKYSPEDIKTALEILFFAQDDEMINKTSTISDEDIVKKTKPYSRAQDPGIMKRLLIARRNGTSLWRAAEDNGLRLQEAANIEKYHTLNDKGEILPKPQR
jgi:hypothetical protein